MAASKGGGHTHDHRNIHPAEERQPDGDARRPCRQSQADLQPNEKGAAFTVTTEAGGEFGAAWKHTSKDGKKEFVSVKLDNPFLAAPIHCALFVQKDGSHVLIWDRDDRKPE